MAKFKDIFKQLRLEKDLKQDEIAKELNISKSSIAMWETGDRNPVPEKFEEIADYFNVDLDYLYGRSPIRRKITYDCYGNEHHNEANFIGTDDSYYINDETREVAQEINDNKNLALLFDAARDAKPEDLQMVHSLLLRLKNEEKGE